MHIDCDVALLQPWIGRLAEASAGYTATLRIRAADDGCVLSKDGEPLTPIVKAGVLYERLLSDVCYALVDGYTEGLAFHAGCVSAQDKCVLIAGVSGAGKTTTTAWLLGRGYDYLTDELVRVPFATGHAHGWPRPLHVKNGSLSVVQAQTRGSACLAPLRYPGGVFIMPESFAARTVPYATPTHALFVRYQRDTPTHVTPLRPAQTATRLVQHLVNARNLQDHGVRPLIALSRRLQAYEVRYSHVEDLSEHLPF
jgi:hypothetical protein